ASSFFFMSRSINNLNNFLKLTFMYATSFTRFLLLSIAKKLCLYNLILLFRWKTFWQTMLYSVAKRVAAGCNPAFMGAWGIASTSSTGSRMAIQEHCLLQYV